jgi:hypothetical protein
LNSVPPPAKPCRRISRTRLSSWWFNLEEGWRTNMGRVQVQQPMREARVTSPRVVPRVKGRQQPCRPLRRYEPRHVCVDRSGALSPYARYEQSVRVYFRRLELHVSTFLHPFAPPALPGFLATMGALTPARRLFVPLLGAMNSAWNRTGLPVSCHRIFRSFRLQPPTVVPTRFWVFQCQAYRTTLPWSPFRGLESVGLRLFPAGSPQRSAESSSLALPTNRSPPVALHPASRRRSYFRLQSARTLWQGLSPCGFDAITGALGGGVPPPEARQSAGVSTPTTYLNVALPNVHEV